MCVCVCVYSFPEYYGISKVLYSCTSKFQVNKYEVSKKMASFGSFILLLFYILEPQRREIVSEEDAYKAYQESVSRGSLMRLCVREKLAILLFTTVFTITHASNVPSSLFLSFTVISTLFRI